MSCSPCRLSRNNAPWPAIRSVLVVCKWMHFRRALMTLKGNLPASIRYYAATYEPAGVTRANWPQNPRMSTANVLKECEGITRYLASGHAAELQRDGAAWI